MKNVAALFVLLCHYQSFSTLIMPDKKWKAILFGVKRLTSEAAKTGCGNHLHSNINPNSRANVANVRDHSAV
jgi:hypothetical protein